tara:strand:+ start:1097 stop:1312 length:216 start_codon:yes stop_codon:yes gene_type:complete
LIVNFDLEVAVRRQQRRAVVTVVAGIEDCQCAFPEHLEDVGVRVENALDLPPGQQIEIVERAQVRLFHDPI